MAEASKKEWSMFAEHVRQEDERICKLYNVPVAEIDALRNVTRRDIDLFAATMLPENTKDLVPIKSTGDGSCLFHSASIALSGEQEYSKELRCRVVFSFVSRFSAYEKLMSDIASADIFSHGLVKETTSDGSYCGLVHLYGLANSLNIEIQSVYPQVNTNIRNTYNTQILPFGGASNISKMIIVWTRTHLIFHDKFWTPNHFVAAVPYDVLPQKLRKPLRVNNDRWIKYLETIDPSTDGVTVAIDLTANFQTCAKCSAALDISSSKNHVCKKCPFCAVHLSDDLLDDHADKVHPEKTQTSQEIAYGFKIGRSDGNQRWAYRDCAHSLCNGREKYKGNVRKIITPHSCVKLVGGVMTAEISVFVKKEFGHRPLSHFREAGDENKCVLYGDEWPSTNYKDHGWGHVQLKRTNKLLAWDVRRCKSKDCGACLNMIAFHGPKTKLICATVGHANSCSNTEPLLSCSVKTPTNNSVKIPISAHLQSHGESSSDNISENSSHSTTTFHTDSSYQLSDFGPDSNTGDSCDEQISESQMTDHMNSDEKRQKDGLTVGFYNRNWDRKEGVTENSSHSTTTFKTDSIPQLSDLEPDSNAGDSCDEQDSKSRTTDDMNSDEKRQKDGLTVGFDNRNWDRKEGVTENSSHSTTTFKTDSIPQLSDLEPDSNAGDSCDEQDSKSQTTDDMNSDEKRQKDGLTVGFDNRNWGRKEGVRNGNYTRRCKGCFVCDTCGRKSTNKAKCYVCSQNVFTKINCGALFVKRGETEHEKGDHACDFRCPTAETETERLVEVNATQKNKILKEMNKGHKWGDYKTISYNTDKQKYRRMCKGVRVCDNNRCPFFQKSGKNNSFYFEGNQTPECAICGTLARKEKCNAFVDIENTLGSDVVKIVRGGSLTCQFYVPTPISGSDDYSHAELQKLFEHFPHLKPKTAMKAVINATIVDSEPSYISETARSLVRSNNISKIRSTVREHFGMGNKGNSFIAASLFKDKTQKVDQFFVFDIVENQYVFTTSKEKLDTAIEITNNKASADGFAHIDFQPSRVKGMTCLGIHAYDGLLKETVSLCKCYAFCEDSGTVIYCLEQLSKAMSKRTGRDILFKPNGWMTDEAGAIHKGLASVYGSSEAERTVTCVAHYMSAVIRNAKKLNGSDDDRTTFTDLARELKNVHTAEDYDSIKSKISDFISGKTERLYLKHWLNWWGDRRAHWAEAFRVKDSPTTNLSECFHAKDWHRGSISQPLIDSIYDDASDSILFKAKTDSYFGGEYNRGTGPSLLELARRCEVNQQNRAGAYGKRVLGGLHIEDESERKKARIQLPSDEECTHREDVRRHEVREQRMRPLQSKLFKQTIARAITQADDYDLIEDSKDGRDGRTFMVLHKEDIDRSYRVCLQEKPVCQCLFFLGKNGKEVCKHIVMTLIALGVEENIINQIAYTETEMYKISSANFTPDHLPTYAGKRQLENNKHKACLVMYKCARGRRPQCSKCKVFLKDGPVIELNGTYKCRNYSEPNHKFKYCPRRDCFNVLPHNSNIKSLPNKILACGISNEDVDQAAKDGLDIL